MEKNSKMFVSPAPHISHKDSVPKIMWIVFISLLPAGIWGVYYFGLPALKIIVASLVTSLLTEAFINYMRKTSSTLSDGSAALTGLLLAYTLPPYIPLYIPIAAAIFAIGVVKHLFGGLGYNVLNPALCGRVFVMFAWIGPMTESKSYTPLLEESFFYQASKESLNAVSSATPMQLMKGVLAKSSSELPTSLDHLIGKVGGSIGEISALFLLLGAVWLFKRKYISWHIPLIFLGSVALLTFFYGLAQNIVIFQDYGSLKNAFVFSYLHLISGGLFLGAFYMATDMVTSPLTRKGQVLFGLGCGILTVIIRLYGGYPEGVMFAILLMQLVVPLIDKTSKPKIYGLGGKK